MWQRRGRLCSGGTSGWEGGLDRIVILPFFQVRVAAEPHFVTFGLAREAGVAETRSSLFGWHKWLGRWIGHNCHFYILAGSSPGTATFCHIFVLAREAGVAETRSSLSGWHKWSGRWTGQNCHFSICQVRVPVVPHLLTFWSST